MYTAELEAKCIPEVQFIIREMERYHLLAQSGSSFKDQFGEGSAALLEFMAKVTHKTTGREFVIGRDALRRFRILAGFIVEARF